MSRFTTCIDAGGTNAVSDGFTSDDSEAVMLITLRSALSMAGEGLTASRSQQLLTCTVHDDDSGSRLSCSLLVSVLPSR
jgi:hypothetical protein